MIIEGSRFGQTTGAALLLLWTSLPARAADQVLSCLPQAADGAEVRVMISESMFSRGRILWPSQAGTLVFEISEKTSVSYTAEQKKDSEQSNSSRLYINRLNGQLQIQVPVGSEAAATLAQFCRGDISRDECATRLKRAKDAVASVCFASIDCTKLTGDQVSGVEASYNCKRSFKKF